MLVEEGFLSIKEQMNSWENAYGSQGNVLTWPYDTILLHKLHHRGEPRWEIKTATSLRLCYFEGCNV